MITGCWLADSEWIGRFSSRTPMNYSSNWNTNQIKNTSRKYQLTSIGWLPTPVPCFFFYHWNNKKIHQDPKKKKIQFSAWILISWCRSRSFGNWSRRLWRGFEYPGGVTVRLRSRLTGWRESPGSRWKSVRKGVSKQNQPANFHIPAWCHFWGPEFSAYLIQVRSAPKPLEDPRDPSGGLSFVVFVGGDMKKLLS